MRSLAGSLIAFVTGGRNGRLALTAVLLAGAPLAAQEPAAGGVSAEFGRAQARSLDYPDARLRPPAAADGSARAGASLEARPMLSARGEVIGGAVGCAFGAWRFADTAADNKAGAAVFGCLLFSIPGMLFGAIWIP